MANVRHVATSDVYAIFVPEAGNATALTRAAEKIAILKGFGHGHAASRTPNVNVAVKASRIEEL